MPAEFDRRSFLIRSAATAAGIAGLAAGGEILTEGIAAAKTNGPGKNGISTAKPKHGGQLIIGTNSEEQGFNPTTAKYDNNGVMYARTVFDPLAIVTSTGGVAPYLAESITPNSDYSVWTITLRPNIKFHDGTDCDAAALLENFEAAKNSLLVGPVLQPVVTSFIQTGPLTVDVNLNSSWVPFNYYLTGQIGGQVAYVAAPSMLRAKNGGTDHPVGTGPFVFENWIPNEHFTATRNDKYWRPGLPYLSSIRYVPIPDAASLSEALQSGTINMMIQDTPQEITKFRGVKTWSYVDDSGYVVGEPDINMILLNTGSAPFNNPNVRLAAAKAIDQSSYSKLIDISVNAPAYGVFVKGTPYYSNTNYPSYDVSEAKKLISQAASQMGKKISFAFGSTTDPYALRSAQYLQKKFQNVGMNVSIKTFQQNELIDNALEGKFQAYGWRQFSAVNPDMNYIFWSTTTVGSEGNISINMTRNSDSQIQTALTTGRTTTDQDTAYAAYQTVNQRFAVDLPYLFLDRAVWACVAQPKVQNFNNPTAPSGEKAFGFVGGSIWPTQIWLT